MVVVVGVGGKCGISGFKKVLSCVLKPAPISKICGRTDVSEVGL